MSPDETGDAATLADLVTACSRIAAFVTDVDREEFFQDLRLSSAVAFQIAIVGEAVKRLSASLRSQHSEVPWKDIAGMRDRLIHGYDNIDLEELWKTASRDVPDLLVKLRRIRSSAER
jgi:uncharacterized protein with HEPN domain